MSVAGLSRLSFIAIAAVAGLCTGVQINFAEASETEVAQWSLPAELQVPSPGFWAEPIPDTMP